MLTARIFDKIKKILRSLKQFFIEKHENKDFALIQIVDYISGKTFDKRFFWSSWGPVLATQKLVLFHSIAFSVQCYWMILLVVHMLSDGDCNL